MGPSQRPLWMLVAESPDAGEPHRSVAGIEMGGLPIAAAGLPAGAEWEIVEKSRVYLRIPAHSDPILFEIAFGAEASRAVEDPVEEIHGGPSRYERVLETRGSLGRTGAAYEVDTLTPPDDNPWKSWLRFTGLDFFADGRAAISTWSGDVWIVSGIDATLERVRWKRFATGLFQPGGLKIVKDQVYVVGRDQITRLQDLNGDGEADYYENFNNDCTDKGNYHEFALDLNTDAEGNFYYSKAGLGANFPGGPIGAHHGCMVKVSPDGKTFEVFATGIRAGAGSGIGPRGEITVSDNDGHWGPASRINLLRRGGYYGDPYTSHRVPPPKDFDAPLCWIHRSVDNSAGAQVWVPGDAWGPFKGRMLHTSYGASALFQVLVDEGDGVAQGGVVRFPFKFSSGALRARFHPTDGQLYVAGLRGWESNASRDGCFQRVRYTGKPVHTVNGMHVTQEGLELTFTNPLDPETAADLDNYSAEWWNYTYSEKYGSPDVSAADPKKVGRDSVDIRSVRLSADGRKVSLEIPGMRPVMQMLVRYRLRAADNSPVTQDLWLTIHRVPGSH
jgi:glucose/arabinose dehydrogenase